MNTFDQFSRYLAKDEPAEFVHWILPRLFTGLRFARWQDAQKCAAAGRH